MARRSVLFAPGDQPELMRKAPGTGADVVVFDLEDAVVPSAKAEARAAVADVLAAVDPECEVCVRVNPDPETAEADLDAILGGAAGPDSLMLPKATGAADVDRLASLAGEYGDVPPVLAFVESAAGVLHAEAVAAADATAALCFGAEDLTADIGATRTREGTEVLYAREHVILAAAATEVDAIDTLVTDFEDLELLREEATTARTMGYDGKIAVHPGQVSVINDAFTPDADQIEWAERVVAAADETDRGAFRLDGEMIDQPLITRAEGILDRARSADGV